MATKNTTLTLRNISRKLDLLKIARDEMDSAVESAHMAGVSHHALRAGMASARDSVNREIERLIARKRALLA